MHTKYVEPSKKEADIIVHSTKHSMETSIDILVTYLTIKSGIQSLLTTNTTVIASDDDNTRTDSI
jgi:uridine kinase